MVKINKHVKLDESVTFSQTENDNYFQQGNSLDKMGCKTNLPLEQFDCTNHCGHTKI